MKYSLDTISLGRFIDVYLGDYSKSVEGDYSEAEQRENAEKMCNEYSMIIGGRRMMALLARRNTALKLQMRLSCLAAGKALANAGFMEDARDVLASMGYKVACHKEALLRKIDSLESSDSYQLQRMTKEDNKRGEAVTREHFTRERVFLMSHLKMYIDEEVFKAKEYAYLLKQVNEELETMKKTINKKR